MVQRVKTSKKIQTGKKGLVEIGIWEPSLMNWRDVFRDYLWILRNRFDNKLSMFKIQFEIYQDLVQSQKALKMYKDVKETPANIKKYTKDVLVVDPAEIERNIKKEKVFIKSLKEIMDGHLWRLFKYNRALIEEMGRQPGTTFISIDEGGFNEVYAWADNILNTDNSHFLLNDLTNSAKISDVTLRNKNGEIELLEIKSSTLASGKKQKERLLRQEARRENFESLANTNKGFIDGVKGEIVELPVDNTNDLYKFRQLVEKADRKGISNLKVQDYLYMTCVDLEIKVKEEVTKRYFSRHRTIQSHRDDIIVTLDTGVRETFSPNFVPLSIFPIPEQFIADLLLGKKIVFYSLNVSKIFNVFKKHGWSIVSSFVENQSGVKIKSLPFCTIRKNNINIDVPWTISNQLIFELQDIKTIIKVFDFTVHNLKSVSRRTLLNYPNDSRIWR